MVGVDAGSGGVKCGMGRGVAVVSEFWSSTFKGSTHKCFKENFSVSGEID